MSDMRRGAFEENLLSAIAGRNRLAEKVGPLALALAEANEKVTALREALDEAREALGHIDCHLALHGFAAGCAMRSLANTALARIDALKGKP